jgi:hypothetical protein
MENKSSATRSKVVVILLVVSLIANVGLFFYGLVNKTVAKKEQEIALESKIQVEKCRLEAEQAKQELQNALTEARQAKDYALAQAMLAAKEAAQKK